MSKNSIRRKRRAKRPEVGMEVTLKKGYAMDNLFKRCNYTDIWYIEAGDKLWEKISGFEHGLERFRLVEIEQATHYGVSQSVIFVKGKLDHEARSFFIRNGKLDFHPFYKIDVPAHFQNLHRMHPRAIMGPGAARHVGT